MSGLGGLNKSPEGVVIGLVQLQLPVVVTKAVVVAVNLVATVTLNNILVDRMEPMSLRETLSREHAAEVNQPQLRS